MQRYSDTAVTDSKGFLLEWGGVGQNFCLAESQSGLYPHKIWARSDGRVEKSVFKVYK